MYEILDKLYAKKVILDQVDYKVHLFIDKKLDKASKIIKIREDNSIITIRS